MEYTIINMVILGKERAQNEEIKSNLYNQEM